MERLKYRRGILQVDALEKRAKEILGQVHSEEFGTTREPSTP